MPTSKAKERLGNLALALFSFLLCAAFAEVLARLTVGRSTPPVSYLSIGRYHPILGWEKNPNTSAHIKRSEYDVHIDVNAHGLRGPDRDYPKGEGKRRVLILGDSFGEGYYVEENETARAILEKEASCPGLEVLNGSTAGYSTDQEYLFFTTEGKRYNPDLVLVFFFSNDLSDNLLTVGNAGRGKPVLVVRGSELVLKNTPVPRGSNPEYQGLPPFHHSVALRWLSNVTKDNLRLHSLLARAGLIPPLTRDPPRDFWPFRSDHPREVDEMWKRFSAILHGLKTAVEEGGGKLAVVYVPIRFEMDDDAWEWTLERYHPKRAWDRDRVIQRLQEVLTELKVPLIDPRDSLRGGGKYFPGDGHWNAKGNAAVGRKLVPFVEETLGCSRASASGGGC